MKRTGISLSSPSQVQSSCTWVRVRARRSPYVPIVMNIRLLPVKLMSKKNWPSFQNTSSVGLQYYTHTEYSKFGSSMTVTNNRQIIVTVTADTNEHFLVLCKHYSLSRSVAFDPRRRRALSRPPLCNLSLLRIRESWGLSPQL